MVKGAQKKTRLKVYAATFGFDESVVAAPNQGAALDAWGVRQNLFAEGQAHLATDEKAIAAALAHPATPLRRAVGSKAAFTLEPAAVSGPPSTASSRARPARPQADRTALDEAQAALDQLRRDRGREAEGFRDRIAVIEAEAAQADERWARRNEAAERAAEKARRAYLKAGGRI